MIADDASSLIGNEGNEIGDTPCSSLYNAKDGFITDNDEWDEGCDADHRKNSSRTDALYEHAIWKAKKLQEKRDQLLNAHDFIPKTNSGIYRSPVGTVRVGRSSVYERLYSSGSRQRTAVSMHYI